MIIAFDGIGKSAAETSSDESRFRYNAKLVRPFVRWKATLPDKSSPKNILSGDRLIARTNCVFLIQVDSFGKLSDRFRRLRGRIGPIGRKGRKSLMSLVSIPLQCLTSMEMTSIHQRNGR